MLHLRYTTLEDVECNTNRTYTTPYVNVASIGVYQSRLAVATKLEIILK
jgi:hypothetical protein